MRDWKAEISQRLIARGLDPTLHLSAIEELSLHLEDRHRSLCARGLSHADAERSVLEELDDEALGREFQTAERVVPSPSSALGAPGRSNVLDSLLLDLRYAARALRRSPGFTAVAVLTLALGVGVNTAIFSVVNAVMLRPLPFGDPSRLVRIYESNVARGWPEFSASDPNFLDWRAQSASWDALAAIGGGTVSLTTASDVDVVPALRVTAEFLPALGITPALGRNFRPEENRQGGDLAVTMISDGLWRRAFGGDPAVIGTTVRLNDAPHTIVGVLPPEFVWGETELLRPLAPDPAASRSDHQISVIGLRKTTVTLDEARAELTGIAARLAQQYPEDNEGWSVRLVSFYDWLIPAETRESLVVLQGAVALVLLIACANVANLLLARGAARSRELAIRVAVGASRSRIVWHGLLESLVLGLISAVVGVAFAAATLRVLVTYAEGIVPRVDQASIDMNVLAFAVVCAMVSATVFGVLPALHAAREHGQALQETSRGTTGGRGRHRLRSALTIAEVALSVSLLIGAGLLLRSFLSLQRVEAGFDVDAVMSGRVMLASATAFDTREKRVDFWRRLTAEISALPGITSVSTGSGIPLTAGNTSTEIAVPGVAPVAGVQPSADWRVVTPGYFATMGIPLRGRDFTEADGPDGPPVIIVSEALARLYWPGEDGVGKTIVPRSLGNRPRTVIGVAGDLRSFGLDGDVRPMIYYSGMEAPVFGQMYLVWRSAVSPQSHVAAIRETIRRVNPQAALYQVATAEDLLSNSFGERRFNLYLLSLFAVVALVLAAVGLFGVMAYLVSQRTREVGVRLALGASRLEVFRLIIGRAVGLAAGGAVLGLVGAAWLTRLMENLLFAISPNDPATFAIVPALLLIVTVIACYIPARRAMRVDPVTALRSE
jgi:putative ABC transport system permease protein